MSQPLLFCAAYAAFCSFGQSIWDSPLSARPSRVSALGGERELDEQGVVLAGCGTGGVEPAERERARRLDGHDAQVHGGWLVARPSHTSVPVPFGRRSISAESVNQRLIWPGCVNARQTASTGPRSRCHV